MEYEPRDGGDYIVLMGGLLGAGLTVVDRIWLQKGEVFAMGLLFLLIALGHFYTRSDPRKRQN